MQNNKLGLINFEVKTLSSEFFFNWLEPIYYFA